MNNNQPVALILGIPALLIAVFAVNSALLWTHGIRDNNGDVFASQSSATRGWVDQIVPDDQSVTLLQVQPSGCQRELGYAYMLTEFFNDRVDAALELGGCAAVKHVIVHRRTGGQIAWNSARDRWMSALCAAQPDTCTPVAVSAPGACIPGVSQPFILMLSSLEKNLYQYEADKIGINKFISKPVKLHELNSTLLSLFEKNMQNDTLHPSFEVIEKISQAASIMVVDDDPINMLLISEVLKRMGFEVIQMHNGREVLESLSHYEPVLIFMDVNMPEMDGIEAAQHIQKLADPPSVIFTTAFDAYALKAFELHAVDYLLKPIRLRRLFDTLARVRAMTPLSVDVLQEIVPEARRHLSVQERGRVVLVPVDKIVFMRAELKYVTIRTAEREHLLEESLTRLEQEFREQFIRIHRSCLVGRDHVESFERGGEEGSESGWVVKLRALDERHAALTRAKAEQAAREKAARDRAARRPASRQFLCAPIYRMRACQSGRPCFGSRAPLWQSVRPPCGSSSLWRGLICS
jgi:two-component system response regulator AlgR